MFQFAPRRRSTRISLTPMIDVVFLLLVFFMLVARFGLDQATPLRLGGGEVWQGAPRLLDVGAEDLRFNGVPMNLSGALSEIARLTSEGGDAIVLRPSEAASLGRVVAVMEALKGAGFTNLVLVEAPE